MKINEIIVESEDLDEAGLWNAIKSGVAGAKNALATNKSNRERAEQTKQNDAEINKLAQIWLKGWWKQASGLPDARLNDATKYANELTAYCKWILHNDKFTIDTPPAITFNPPKNPPPPTTPPTPPVVTKNDVNPQSVEAFIKVAIAQRNVQPAAAAPAPPPPPAALPKWNEPFLFSPATKRKFEHLTDGLPAVGGHEAIPGQWQQTHKNNRLISPPVRITNIELRKQLDAAMQDAINRGFGSV